MFRIEIINIPKRSSAKLNNHFYLKAVVINNDDGLGLYYFYIIDFYLSPKFNDKPLRYLKFMSNRELDKIAPEIYQKINDLPQNHHKLTENFSIELFLKRLRASMFDRDRRLANINFFVTNKDCLNFSLRLLDLIDEKTTNKTDYEEMENFLTSNLTFLYLLSI
jgi:hypothetical protein